MKVSCVQNNKVMRKSVCIPSQSGPHFCRIRTEYGEIGSISPYSVRIRENPDENNSENGHFSRSDYRDIFLSGMVSTPFIHQHRFYASKVYYEDYFLNNRITLYIARSLHLLHLIIPT